MKKRLGFVSNSSSSSFICEVCGSPASGRDIGLEEAGMFECEKGHVFCEEHYLKGDDVTQIVKNIRQDEEDDRYSISEVHCPICQQEAFKDNELIEYLLKKNNTDRDSIIKEINDKFSSYDELMNYIKKGENKK